MSPPQDEGAPLAGGAGSIGSGFASKGSTRATGRELLATRRGDPLAAHLAEMVALLGELAAIERRRRVA